MVTLPKKLVAEFIGTFFLVFIGAGSVCADQFMKATGGDGIGLLGIAVAFGLAVTVAVSATGHISGGHINPAVTIGFWVTKRMGLLDTVAYWAAQLGGGIAAAALLQFLIPQEVWSAPGVMLGATTPTADFPIANAIILEAVLTFFLVFVVFATAVDDKGAFSKVAGFAIGLTVAMDILVGGPFTGASMNPARSFGPAVMTNFWRLHSVYWVGPLLGGTLAAALYSGLFLRKAEPAA